MYFTNQRFLKTYLLSGFLKRPSLFKNEIFNSRPISSPFQFFRVEFQLISSSQKSFPKVKSSPRFEFERSSHFDAKNDNFDKKKLFLQIVVFHFLSFSAFFAKWVVEAIEVKLLAPLNKNNASHFERTFEAATASLLA